MNNTNHSKALNKAAYTSNFSLSAEDQKLLTHYKYLKWDSEFFLGNWESNVGTYAAGTIHRYNQLFHVAFTNGISIGLLKSLRSRGISMQLALSFRKAPNQPAYVIVGSVNQHDFELAA